MSTPIHNRHGTLVGWLDDEVIRTLPGRHVAFVSNSGVFSYRGRYLGRFHDGFFRDRRGGTVAFIPGACGGPVTPIPPIAPIPPVFPVPPVPPVPPVAPVAPVDSLSWSSEDWETFLGG